MAPLAPRSSGSTPEGTVLGAYPSPLGWSHKAAHMGGDGEPSWGGEGVLQG